MAMRRRFLLSWFSVVFLAAAAPPARADPLRFSQGIEAITLTFDDVPSCCNPMLLSAYGGLTWQNFAAYEVATIFPPSSKTGYVTGNVSGDTVAFNGSGRPAALYGRAFTFNSGYFTAAWNPGLVLDIVASAAGVELFSTQLILGVTGTLLFAPNWSGIDRLSFVSYGGIPTSSPAGGPGTQFVLDNFTFTPAPVPEPATLLLLGGGLVTTLSD
jgi:hypothetical protein